MGKGQSGRYQVHRTAGFLKTLRCCWGGLMSLEAASQEEHLQGVKNTWYSLHACKYQSHV